jgi:hypothetical protein
MLSIFCACKGVQLNKLPRLLGTTLLKGEECLTYQRRHALVAFVKWQNGTDRQIDR